jgi:hypothetical protein
LKRFFAFKEIEEIEVHAEEIFLELASERRYTYIGAWLRRFNHILDKILAITLPLKERKSALFY